MNLSDICSLPKYSNCILWPHILAGRPSLIDRANSLAENRELPVFSGKYHLMEVIAIVKKSKAKKSIKFLSLGLVLLSLFSLHSERLTPGVKEASVFNGSQHYSSQQALNEGSNSQVSKVIPLGSAFGIKLFTDGVIVASLSEIPTGESSGKSSSCPAKDAGIQPGDYILSIDGETMENNLSLARKIGSSQGQVLKMTVRRGEKEFDTSVTPVFSDGSFKTGMWVRDSAAGIGTLTFYNPESGVFAGLGHGICDMDTRGVMSLGHGEPADITLCGIVPGKENNPGQLQGYFTSDQSMGELLINNDTGVYGTLYEPPEGELMEVAPKNEVHTGEAQLLVSTDETGPKRYSAVIEEINHKEQRTRNLVVKVTDEELLKQTGGIVQGMSGCPIIQDDRLVGAVTHVFVEDPKTGYGIFADTMVIESVVFSMS